MKKKCFEVAAIAVFLFSAIQSIGQTTAQPALERHSSPQQKTKDVIVPPSELKKLSQTDANVNKNKTDSLQQLNPPQLKRTDSSPTRKDNTKNTK